MKKRIGIYITSPVAKITKAKKLKANRMAKRRIRLIERLDKSLDAFMLHEKDSLIHRGDVALVVVCGTMKALLNA